MCQNRSHRAIACNYLAAQEAPTDEVQHHDRSKLKFLKKISPEKEEKPKQSRRANHLEGLALLRAANIDHAKFQRLHWRFQEPMPVGHWGKFVQHIVGVGVLKCKACQELGAEQSRQASSQNLPPQQELLTISSDDETDGKPGERGRPSALQTAPSLASWIQLHRPGLYVARRHRVYYCVCCMREVAVEREVQSGKKSILQHEQTNLHRQASKSTQPPCAVFNRPATWPHLATCGFTLLRFATGSFGWFEKF